jgi:hypothetical protein
VMTIMLTSPVETTRDHVEDHPTPITVCPSR